MLLGMDDATYKYTSKRAQFAADPWNLTGQSLHDYTAGQFEQEGYRAAAGSSNPYRPGTMAATRWDRGAADARAEWAAMEAAPDAPKRVPCKQGHRHEFLHRSVILVHLDEAGDREAARNAAAYKAYGDACREWSHRWGKSRAKSKPAPPESPPSMDTAWKTRREVLAVTGPWSYLCQHCGAGCDAVPSSVRTDYSGAEPGKWTADERKQVAARPIVFTPDMRKHCTTANAGGYAIPKYEQKERERAVKRLADLRPRMERLSFLFREGPSRDLRYAPFQFDAYPSEDAVQAANATRETATEQ